jgi:hypothetical protein
MTNIDKEIKFLKKIIKAQTHLLLFYRLCKQPQEWVFEILNKAENKYGNLSKIL